jgi:hypothetical protein
MLTISSLHAGAQLACRCFFDHVSFGLVGVLFESSWRLEDAYATRQQLAIYPLSQCSVLNLCDEGISMGQGAL